MNQNILDYIPDDGYTEEAFVKAIPTVHGDFRFSFRPMPIDLRTKFFAKLDKAQPGENDQQCAAEMAKRVTAWQLMDAKGTAIPINPANALRLKPLLFNRVFGIIVGTQASDVDPTWTNETKEEIAERAALAAACGRDPGQQREATDEGN